MNFFGATLLLLLAPSLTEGSKRGKEMDVKTTFTAPHEIHQYEQTKFYDEPKWECRFAALGSTHLRGSDSSTATGGTTCMACRNPGGKYDNALIVEVKAMYKRANWNEKDEANNKPRKHCIFPGRGEFWTCFDSNLVIEPDSDWLGSLKDKPIYDAEGLPLAEGADPDDGVCYPGSLAGDIDDNGATQPDGSQFG
eukprot:CAMPEP_0201890710 /NCGR_PEP_ID=MMETSP0902-20130614/32802_1 /ASSEMBLY_ACC=CAM_ASM_000551 /TAXON_ID=420261 /ORGANISM="Thalassiosira antarctica, Strain CCMP982" /LENGTH=194 /DNA_ID=CAMNT_0048421647 /DNA_START=51 /DNA_END=632 /DNA_ORIENTATION=+